MRYKYLSFDPGDILVFSGRGPVSALVKVATCSPYSHVGMVAQVAPADLLFSDPHKAGKHPAISEDCPRNWQTRNLLFESTTLSSSPCEITGKRINGVQAHDPAAIVRGFRGRVYRMELNPPRQLTKCHDESHRLTAALLGRIGTSYDIPGSILSGTRILKRLFPGCAANRQKLVCVEYVAWALQEAFKRRRLPMELKPGQLTPGQLVRRLCRAGIYSWPKRIW